jgi:hypothetical protein
MAVTSQDKRRLATTRAAAMKRKSTVKGRNAPAAALADPRYRARVVKSAKVYSRKDKAKPIEDEDL